MLQKIKFAILDMKDIVVRYVKTSLETKSLTLCKPISYYHQSKIDIVPLWIFTLILPTIGVGYSKDSLQKEKVLITEFPTQFTVRRIDEYKYTAIYISVLGFGIAISAQLDY